MEIERKYLPSDPSRLADRLVSLQGMHMVQAYLNTDPVIRIRREGDSYVLTYKGSGMLAREEYNLPLNKDSWDHLLGKCDGRIIEKTRYRIPLESTDEALVAEVDVFERDFSGLILIEVEFPSMEAADHFTPPDWFGEDVTYRQEYHNSYMSLQNVTKSRI